MREIQAHCPFCSADRRLVVRGEHSRTVMDGDGSDEIDCLRILECTDCRRGFVRRDHWKSGDREGTRISYWPTGEE